jgi:hypothetical protein
MLLQLLYFYHNIYVKLLFIAWRVLFPTHLLNSQGETIKTVFAYNPSIQFFHNERLPLALLSIINCTADIQCCTSHCANILSSHILPEVPHTMQNEHSGSSYICWDFPRLLQGWHKWHTTHCCAYLPFSPYLQLFVHTQSGLHHGMTVQFHNSLQYCIEVIKLTN